jgi:hypothetical protein
LPIIANPRHSHPTIVRLDQLGEFEDLVDAFFRHPLVDDDEQEIYWRDKTYRIAFQLLRQAPPGPRSFALVGLREAAGRVVREENTRILRTTQPAP